MFPGPYRTVHSRQQSSFSNGDTHTYKKTALNPKMQSQALIAQMTKRLRHEKGAPQGPRGSWSGRGKRPARARRPILPRTPPQYFRRWQA